MFVLGIFVGLICALLVTWMIQFLVRADFATLLLLALYNSAASHRATNKSWKTPVKTTQLDNQPPRALAKSA